MTGFKVFITVYSENFDDEIGEVYSSMEKVEEDLSRLAIENSMTIKKIEAVRSFPPNFILESRNRRIVVEVLEKTIDEKLDVFER